MKSFLFILTLLIANLTFATPTIDPTVQGYLNTNNNVSLVSYLKNLQYSIPPTPAATLVNAAYTIASADITNTNILASYTSSFTRNPLAIAMNLLTLALQDPTSQQDVYAITTQIKNNILPALKNSAGTYAIISGDIQNILPASTPNGLAPKVKEQQVFGR